MCCHLLPRPTWPGPSVASRSTTTLAAALNNRASPTGGERGGASMTHADLTPLRRSGIASRPRIHYSRRNVGTFLGGCARDRVVGHLVAWHLECCLRSRTGQAGVHRGAERAARAREGGA